MSQLSSLTPLVAANVPKSNVSTAPSPSDTELARIKKAATDLEATFLAEMLKSAGMGEARGAFGGGEGESQFSSMLVTEHAKAMAKAGGIGLAEQFVTALQQRMDSNGQN